MSRIGKNPVALPKGVEVRLDGRTVVAKGPKGELKLPLGQGIDVACEPGKVVVARTSDAKQAKAQHGTTRALIANMVDGVLKGYTRKLEIVGVGYRAQLQGKKLTLNVGFANTIELMVPAGITVTCPDQTHIEVSGIDKQLVGQFAAQVRSSRKPEPYKGKGVRYDGEQVRRKAGKQGK